MVFAVSATATEAEQPKTLTFREVYHPPAGTSSNGRIVPIKHDNKADFGAEIYGIDLNNFTAADFELISDALHRHKLLVFKEQPEMLTPKQQYRLTSWFVRSWKAFRSLGHANNLIIQFRSRRENRRICPWCRPYTTLREWCHHLWSTK